MALRITYGDKALQMNKSLRDRELEHVERILLDVQHHLICERDDWDSKLNIHTLIADVNYALGVIIKENEERKHSI